MPISTRRLLLRDFDARDRESVHEYASDPAVTQYLSWGPNTQKDTDAFLERVSREAAQTPRASFELAVVEIAVGRVVGGCGLFGRRESEFELGYCLRRETWGQGIATEAAGGILRLGFQFLHAHRVYAIVDPDNRSSARVLEKLGFRREGRFTRDTLIRGEWRDSVSYALLTDDWARRRERAAQPRRCS